MSRKYRPAQLRIGGIPYAPRIAPKEKQIAQDCKDVLARHGYLVFRIQCGTWRTLHGHGFYTGAPNGTPDYVAIHPRRPGFLLETKRERGVLSPSQIAQHQVIQQGWHVSICTVCDAVSLEAWLREFEGQDR